MTLGHLYCFGVGQISNVINCMLNESEFNLLKKDIKIFFIVGLWQVRSGAFKQLKYARGGVLCAVDCSQNCSVVAGSVLPLYFTSNIHGMTQKLE